MRSVSEASSTTDCGTPISERRPHSEPLPSDRNSMSYESDVWEEDKRIHQLDAAKKGKGRGLVEIIEPNWQAII
ncbi:unnamed protein product [Blepharisma stoltei]|uniref:Uncharacterized protein n=1 Tax=Blepharisma stoltei TaxID=1481888 RepID=A0AAU9JVT2_9CILI|nr:unnamed protein product [Blepharisma stoltei]